MADERDASNLVLAFALVFPTLVTLAYFVLLDGWPAKIQLTTYTVGKIAQFVFPVAYLVFILQHRLTLPQPAARGIWFGLGFGILVALLMLGLFYGWFKPQGFFDQPREKIYGKVAGWGMTAAWQFALLGLFYALAHSFLEEYYWRWFVFGGLCQMVSPGWAHLLAGAAFMSHHIIVLLQYFPVPLTIFLSLMIGVGGVIWSWMYLKK